MSGRQLTRDELEDRLDTLEAAVEDLQTELDRRAAVTCESGLVEDVVVEGDAGLVRIGKTVSRAATEWELEEVRDELPDTDVATDDDLRTLHAERAKLARRLCRVEEALDIDDPIAAAESRNQPLHLLERVGPEAVTSNPSETLRRAKVLVENKNRWGQTKTNPKHGQHRYLSSRKHDLKTRLEDARDENLAWRQVYRAMRKLADLGGSDVCFDESDSHGKMVIFRSGWSE